MDVEILELHLTPVRVSDKRSFEACELVSNGLTRLVLGKEILVGAQCSQSQI